MGSKINFLQQAVFASQINQLLCLQAILLSTSCLSFPMASYQRDKQTFLPASPSYA